MWTAIKEKAIKNNDVELLTLMLDKGIYIDYLFGVIIVSGNYPNKDCDENNYILANYQKGRRQYNNVIFLFPPNINRVRRNVEKCDSYNDRNALLNYAYATINKCINYRPFTKNNKCYLLI